MSNKETISRLLGTLAILFQDKKTSEEFYEIYQEFLADISDEIIIKAIKSCIRECRFFPTIAEIRQKAEPFLEAEKLKTTAISEQTERERQLEICRANIEKGGDNYLICEGWNYGCQYAHKPECNINNQEFQKLLKEEE